MRGLFRQSLVLVTLTVAFSSVLAQEPGGGGGGGGTPPERIEKMIQFGNVMYGMLLEGTTTDGTKLTVNGQKVSGTNVNIKVTVGSGYVAAPPGGSPIIDRAEVSDIEIYILGGTESDDTLPGQTPIKGVIAGGTGNYRFSSTFFADNSEIKVRATATFTFYELDGTSHVIPYDDFIKLTVYNRTGRVSSQVLEEATPYELLLFKIITRGVISASNALPNHAISPFVWQSQELDREGVLDRVVISTVFVTATHGSPFHVYDSFGYPPPLGDHFINLNDAPPARSIISEVAAKGNLPGFNVIVFYACYTINLPNPGIKQAFGISGADRAHLGFEDNISGGLVDKFTLMPTDETLSDHADRLFDALAAGATVAQAIFVAQSQNIPAKPIFDENDEVVSYEAVPMIIAGDYDRFARLHFVYLTEAERDHLLTVGESLDKHLVKLPVAIEYPGGN